MATSLRVRVSIFWHFGDDSSLTGFWNNSYYIAVMNLDEIKRLRREYAYGELRTGDLHSNPFEQFNMWFQDALNANIDMADAMTLATVSATGVPSARIVALRGYDEQGFIFYTNYQSNKAVDIKHNPHAALVFYWKELDRQVRIIGTVRKTARGESGDYFSSRPMQSNLVQVASRQSQVVSSKEVIKDRINRIKQKHKNSSLVCPPYWGGYRVFPTEFEFWQGGLERLHDRFRYQWKDNSWKISQLEP
ncbi:MAG: pyridoxamine 5'-phosphate oxidase [Candidatus Andersenbacteria bacterium]